MTRAQLSPFAHLVKKVSVKRVPARMLFALMLTWFITAPLADADQMTGQWRGRWVSQKTGHKGPLNARFYPLSSTQYRAVYTGRFAKVIPFRYGMNMQVQSRDANTIYFAGSRSLGIFGKFEYQAHATNCQFVATYQSRRDRGRFEMRKQ